MKTKLLPYAFFGLVALGAVAVARADKPASPVSVTFVEPEKFTDVKDDALDTENGHAAVLDQLKDHLQARGAKYLAAGQRLEIKVTDVDLAGDFEPWHGVNFQDVRIVKDMYPPRVSLEFKLLDASGKVLSEGRRELRSLGFLLTSPLPSWDPLRYDKEVLSDWLRQEFKRSA